MPVRGKSTEKELATAAMRYLAEHPLGSAPYSEIIPQVPKFHALTLVDQAPSTTRPGEEMWEQRVRNITSHAPSSGNFINRGLLSSVPDGLKLTERGRSYLRTLP